MMAEIQYRFGIVWVEDEFPDFFHHPMAMKCCMENDEIERHLTFNSDSDCG
jgi:hypothetical protein